MKYQQQHDLNDCGPACLVMVASQYKYYTTIGEMRSLCKTDAIGTNFAGLVNAANKIGFKTVPLRGEVNNKTLDSKLVFPCIAHVKAIVADHKYDHYIVIKKITKGSVFIYDPDFQKGKYKVSRKEFLNIWTGYLLLVIPDMHFIPQKGDENILLKFVPLLAHHKEILVTISLASLLIVIFGIITSFYYKYVIDDIIISGAGFTLFALSIGILFIVIINSIVEAGRNILINYFSNRISLQLIFSYIAHILKLPLAFFDSLRTGEIVSRINDIGKIQFTLSNTFLSVIMDIFLVIIIGPILFSMNSILFFITMISIVIITIIIYFFAKLYRKYYTKKRNEEAAVDSTLIETINGVYTVKALNAEARIFNLFEEKQIKATWTTWRTGIIYTLQQLLIGLVYTVTNIIIFWYGSFSIIQDELSFGMLISFNALAVYFTGPFFRLVNLQATLQEAYVAAERVNEIFMLDAEQKEGIMLQKLGSLKGRIKFNNVSFKYGMRQTIFKDLSFSIDEGDCVGFVGPSGSGKTTLVKLLLKFYLPEKGSITIDEYDLSDIDAVNLRSHIGYVPQDIQLFSGTIADNITMHNSEVPFEEIVKAAQLAGADEFINGLPERYNTRVSERGSTLSGGERQRLALARAMLNKPDVMVFDEATSNLDAISEKAIHNAIKELRKNITTIIIAHRLTTIKDCDKIFVMDKGAIVESGNHEELLLSNGLYRLLWDNMIT